MHGASEHTLHLVKFPGAINETHSAISEMHTETVEMHHMINERHGAFTGPQINKYIVQLLKRPASYMTRPEQLRNCLVQLVTCMVP